MESSLPPATAFGDVVFEPVTGELRLDGQTQRLRPQTAAVLAQLLTHAGTLVRRDDLSKAVWGDVLVTENSVTQCITEIRRALGPDREAWLKTHARRGYRLDTPAAAPTTAGGNDGAPISAEPASALMGAESPATGALSLPERRRAWTTWSAVAAGALLMLAAGWA